MGILSTQENFENSLSGKKLICFGAGKLFGKFLEYSKNSFIKVDEIWDNDVMKQGQIISWHENKIEIMAARHIVEEDKINYVILITCGKVKEIWRQLIQMEIAEEQIFIFPFFEDYSPCRKKQRKMRIDFPALDMLKRCSREFQLDDIEKEKYQKIVLQKLHIKRRGLVIPYLTLLITSHCTLRCKECSNLIPYCENKSHLPADLVIEDIRRVSDAIDYCICIDITGGEPFLHPDLDKIVKTAINNEKILFVQIITNGTVIPERKILLSLKNHKVIVKISKYNRYSKIEELKDLFDKEKIRYLVNEEIKWVAQGGIERRGKRHDRIVYEYLRCWSGKFCKSVWKGKLYACARAAYLHEIGASQNADDYVELTGLNLKSKITEFYLVSYLDACDFCDHMSLYSEEVEPAVQISEK